MTVARKIWLAFGVLSIIVLIVGAVGYLGVRSVHKAGQPAAVVERAEDEAAAQMQRIVAGTEAAVFGYLETGDPEYRERFDEHARAFEQARNRYEQSVAAQPEEEAVARVESAYEQYRAVGEDLVAKQDRQTSLLSQSEANIAGAAAILSRIQAEMGEKEPDRFDKVVEADRMTGSIRKMGARVSFYLADEGRDSQGSTKGVSEDFEAALESFRELDLTEQQEAGASELETLFDETEPLLGEAISLKTSQRADVSRFLALRADIDERLSAMQSSARGDVAAAQVAAQEAAEQASFNASAAILTVLIMGLALAGIIAATFGGGIVRSVRKLAQGATDIAKDDLDHHLEVSTKDEIGVVASALNRVAEERRYDREELRHLGKFLEDRTKRVAELEAIVADLHDEKHALHEERQHNGFADLPARGVFDWDLRSNAVHWDEGALRLFGASREDLDPTYDAFLNLLPPEDQDVVEEARKLSLEHGIGPQVNIRIAAASGEVQACTFRAEARYGHDGEPVRLVGSICEIDESETVSQQTARRGIDGAPAVLPDRAGFISHLDQASLRSSAYAQPLAVLMVELDNFKGIYSAFGYEPTERLLASVAERLKSSLQAEDFCARLENNVFAILLERRDESEARYVAERISEEMKAPFTLDGRHVSVSISIGIALNAGAEDERPAEDLIHAAHCAAYRARQSGKTQHAVFDSSMSAQALERVELESDLRLALEREELIVYYQPKVMLNTLDVFAFEALVRWNHPKRGLMLPDDFVPLAEETGLIVPIGQWVLREACRQGRAWQDRYPGAPPLMISVNLSPQQLYHPELVESIIQVLVDTRFEPQSLMLEVTEGVLVEDLSRVRSDLQQLRELGVRIAVDDFGTAYSSLSRLKGLPVDVLKLDRSFTAGLGQGDDDSDLVAGVIGLASGLGVEVIAEGVENSRQLGRLRDAGCARAQGYYFSRPVPSGNATALLEAARGD